MTVSEEVKWQADRGVAIGAAYAFLGKERGMASHEVCEAFLASGLKLEPVWRNDRSLYRTHLIDRAKWQEIEADMPNVSLAEMARAYRKKYAGTLA